MLLDIIFAVVIILAILKGYRSGLVVGLFSLVAVIIGLAAAMKLSTVVAGYIGKAVKVSDEWLPVISFAVVFFIVILLIRLGARAIEKTVEVAMLGWVNKIGGVILFAAIYTVVFSVLLFYAEQMKLVERKRSINLLLILLYNRGAQKQSMALVLSFPFLKICSENWNNSLMEWLKKSPLIKISCFFLVYLIFIQYKNYIQISYNL